MAWIILFAVYDFMGTPYADNEVKEEIEAILRLSRRGKPELVEKGKKNLNLWFRRNNT